MIILGASLILLLLFQGQGLPVNLPITLAQPLAQPDKRPLPSEPIGRWACLVAGETTEVPSFIVTIRLRDKAHYGLSLSDPDPSVPSQFTDRPAHLSRGGVVSLLNIDMGPSKERTTNYWFGRLRNTGGRLDLDIIGNESRLPSDPEQAWALVQQRIDDPTLYAIQLRCRRAQRT